MPPKKAGSFSKYQPKVEKVYTSQQANRTQTQVRVLGPAKGLWLGRGLDGWGLGTGVLDAEAAQILACLLGQFGQLDHRGRDFFRSGRVADGDTVQAAEVGVDLFDRGRLLLQRR